MPRDGNSEGPSSRDLKSTWFLEAPTSPTKSRSVPTLRPVVALMSQTVPLEYLGHSSARIQCPRCHGISSTKREFIDGVRCKQLYPSSLPAHPNSIGGCRSLY